MTTKANARVLNNDTRQFSLKSPVQFAIGEQSGEEGKKVQRQFSGVAYSGEVIKSHFYWGDVIFDLSTTSIPDKLPALINHDRNSRCGYVTEFGVSESAGITVVGNLLSNDSGKAVAQESDEGFPWQMSIHIEPGSVEEIKTGTTVLVNGKSLSGPLTIFRNSTVSEVSFTATGWDPNTTAAAMSKSGELPNSVEDNIMTSEEIQALQAQNAKLKADADAATAALANFSRSKREGEIKALYSDIGREFKEGEEDTKAFSQMSDEGFASVAKVMRETFKPAATTPSANLFSHQATTGSVTAPGTTAPAEDPLVADAKNRSTQFTKQHAAFNSQR